MARAGTGRSKRGRAEVRERPGQVPSPQAPLADVRPARPPAPPLQPRAGGLRLELLYARNSILEVLRAGRRRVHYLAMARGARISGALEEILTRARALNLPVHEVARTDLDALAPGHQGVILEASPYPYVAPDDLYARTDGQALYLLLDCLEDPQNLGTLLRTADAVGVTGVLLPEHRSVSVTPAVSAASAGAVEHLAVAQVGNLVQAMEVLKVRGAWLVGLEDVPEAQVYDRADWSGCLALVVGSEGRGMRPLVRERCDWLVRLPMAGHVGSLNAAVAGSIVLYHAWRART